MDAIVTELVNRFERGRISRRELIQGLSALMAPPRLSPLACAPPGPTLTRVMVGWAAAERAASTPITPAARQRPIDDDRQQYMIASLAVPASRS